MEIIIAFEGFSATVYTCPGGYLTIGYGHMLNKNEHNITIITKEQAIDYLKNDCIVCLNAINRLVKVPLNPNQLAALISFCYNVGTGNFQRSTMRQKLNRGEYNEAAQEFLRWDKVNGRTLLGLTRRRQAEFNLFLKTAAGRFSS